MSNDPTRRAVVTEGIGPGLPPLTAAVRGDIVRRVRGAVDSIPRNPAAPLAEFERAVDLFIDAGAMIGAGELFQWLPPTRDRLSCCLTELLEYGSAAHWPRHLVRGIGPGLVVAGTPQAVEAGETFARLQEIMVDSLRRLAQSSEAEFARLTDLAGRVIEATFENYDAQEVRPERVEAAPMSPPEAAEATAPLPMMDATTQIPLYLSAADLAQRINRPAAAVETFLRRHRKTHKDCYVQTNSRRKRETLILYRVAEVWGPLQTWAEKYRPRKRR